jgi:hypothetical protein
MSWTESTPGTFERQVGTRTYRVIWNGRDWRALVIVAGYATAIGGAFRYPSEAMIEADAHAARTCPAPFPALDLDPIAPAPAARPAGKARHVCGGPAFGRLAAPGACPRCDELRAGAAPRAGWGDRRRRFEAARSAAIYAHDCKRSGCGPVCTFGDP